ncbi:MAG TPA: catalase [Myxococcota bacterium]|nr:catalase [Myxococcota bacterium]
MAGRDEQGRRKAPTGRDGSERRRARHPRGGGNGGDPGPIARAVPPASPAPKADDLARFLDDPAGKRLTTNQGVPIEDDQHTLRAGERGPSLLEDFHFREKITHFDHERIPERVVHARGAGAHGYFQPYASLARYTRARFLGDPSVRTPVFVRFSTVAGSRGSTDMPRDVRGFATKFYTEEGVFDLVGNNMPVFFIQDALKFPDLIHAVKPEQDNEMPQAASAHDTFWDFVSLTPESMHMILWLMSDRAIPRSFRMMEGFGVHTFRFVDEAGTSRFVKFHWKPMLGVHAVAWDEAQRISGKDPDFLRRDLWDAIEQGNPAEYELGIQVVEAEREHDFPFDLLDPTKIIPEELVPVERVGRLVLNRNPENFFAETEQVAFHPGHLVPGIDFTDDPLLQGRLFSYTDTQLIRLGGPNFHEIPINRSVAPVHNHQREGFMRQSIQRGKASYEPNSIGGGCPMQVRRGAGGFVSFPEPLRGAKLRTRRSKKFYDHFSQATLFFESQSPPEQDHIVEALRFELGKVERPHIRQRVIGLLGFVSETLASRVAAGFGLTAIPRVAPPINHHVPADGAPEEYAPRAAVTRVDRSPALSMTASPMDSIRSRRIALLVADGVDAVSLRTMRAALLAEKAAPVLVAPRLGPVRDSNGDEHWVEQSLLTGASVLFDAVYVPGGGGVATLVAERDAVDWIAETYRHCKPIAATGEGVALLRRCPELVDAVEAARDDGAPPPRDGDAAIVVSASPPSEAILARFVSAIAHHRNWTRAGRNRLGGDAADGETRGCAPPRTDPVPPEAHPAA